MKINKNISLIILPLVILSSAFVIQSQEVAKSRSSLKIYYNNESGVKSLVATLKVKQGKQYIPFAGIDVNFYFVADTSNILIGTNQTDETGKSVLYIPDDFEYGDQPIGIYAYEAVFNGTGKYKASSASTQIKNVQMEVSFSQKEEEKLIILNVSEVQGIGDLLPVNGVDVMFYVPRTFTLLKVGEGTLTDGKAVIDFPITLPGDSLGYLTIVAKIEDNDDYGYAETSGSINWGKPLPPMKIAPRGLGDTNAPLWMVYTLIVLLSTVWFHYLYAIFTIYRIKREGNKTDIKAEDLINTSTGEITKNNIHE